MSGTTTLVIVGIVMFALLGGLTLLSHMYTLNGIKSKTVGDGQHGTARWATKSEIKNTYARRKPRNILHDLAYYSADVP